MVAARSGSPRGIARVPRIAAAAWVLAAVVLGVLVVAVRHYLNATNGTGHGGMAGMAGMGTADALTRGGGQPLGPLSGSALITSWQLDAVALAVLVLAAAAYLTGVALVPIRQPGQRWPWMRTLSFFAGLAVCAFATNGSIAVYDQVLFSAHMLGHLALVMLAPVLLLAGRPLRLLLLASPDRRREHRQRIARGRLVSVLTAPPVALASYTAVIVGSHLTDVMDTVMRNAWAGQLEHLVYVLVGCQFFVLVVGDEPIRWRLGAPARWLLLAVAMAVDTFTGIVLLQGTREISMVRSAAVHVNALSDTRTGGAIMWVGGDAIMAAVMIVLALSWLRSVDNADTARERDRGWLEQARRATFTEHTGASGDTDEILDEDDAAHASYNKWLADLARNR